MGIDSIKQKLLAHKGPVEILGESTSLRGRKGFKVKAKRLGDGKTPETAFRPDVPDGLSWACEPDGDRPDGFTIFVEAE